MLISMLCVFAAMSVITRFWTGNWIFVTPENLSNLAQQVTQTGILAVGMTLVILIGGIDLSVGSILAVAAIVLAQSGIWFEQAGAAAPYLSIVCALLTGTLLGIWNGTLIARFKLLPFVVTLAMLTIGRGLAYMISGSQSIRVKEEIFKIIGVYSIDRVCYTLCHRPVGLPVFTIGMFVVVFVLWVVFRLRSIQRNKSFGYKVEEKAETMLNIAAVGIGCAVVCAIFSLHQGIPVMVLMFAALAAATSFLLNRSLFVRHLYAIGGNREAARLSGINVSRCVFIVFALMGFLCGVAGIVAPSRAQAASPATQGILAELEAIAAVVVGGTSLSGGVGTIGGTCLGVLIIGMVVNGMILMALPNPIQLIFKGLLIMIAILVDMRTKVKK